MSPLALGIVLTFSTLVDIFDWIDNHRLFFIPSVSHYNPPPGVQWKPVPGGDKGICDLAEPYGVIDSNDLYRFLTLYMEFKYDWNGDGKCDAADYTDFLECFNAQRAP